MKKSSKLQVIQPDELCVGIYVHLDLGWMDHPFTFSNFMIKNEDQIKKIRALKLAEIRYDPARSIAVPKFPKTILEAWAPKVKAPAPAAVDPQLRSSRLNQLNKARLECEREFAHHVNSAREANRILVHHPEHAKKIADDLVQEMVGSIITESEVTLHAIASNSSMGNTSHTVSVSVLALMMAKALDMTEADASTLGLAAIFHDAGKAEIQQSRFGVDLHCEAGARITLRAGLSERISNIILQHHEFSDGSGFPMHITEDKIDELARVLIIVNHFDNLCNPSDATEAMTPYEALQHMYVYQAQKFDMTLLKRFIKMLGVYPSGSVVQLSNGSYGIVMTVNPDKPLQPVVMVYAPEVTRETPVVIDLREEATLSITHCINPKKLTQEALNYLQPGKRICYYFMKNDEPGNTPPAAKDSDQPKLDESAINRKAA